MTDRERESLEHDSEAESLEQIDQMAGEVVSGRVLTLVYGTLAMMIVVGLAVLWSLGPGPAP